MLKNNNVGTKGVNMTIRPGSGFLSENFVLSLKSCLVRDRVRRRRGVKICKASELGHGVVRNSRILGV